MKNLYVISFIILFWSCNQSQETEPTIINEPEIVEEIQEKKHLIHDHAARSNGNINVVVEIPTGSIEKWEVNKSTGELEWEMVDGKPRKMRLNYLSKYPLIFQSFC